MRNDGLFPCAIDRLYALCNVHIGPHIWHGLIQYRVTYVHRRLQSLVYEQDWMKDRVFIVKCMALFVHR